MNKDYIKKLTKQRELAVIKLAQAQREIEVIDDFLKNAQKNTTYEPKALPKINKKSPDYVYFSDLIVAQLLKHKKGLRTGELFDYIRKTSNREPNYSTFRSYLTRMKKKRVILQDKKRYWIHIHHKEIKPPVIN